jgi:curli production assembly/transport component CsgG
MKFFVIFAMLMLASCAPASMQSAVMPPYVSDTPLKEGLRKFPQIGDNMPPVSVAVYSFLDRTGQRKPADNIASISTAVTQGAEIYLIKALADLSDGKWFSVVERAGMDNLIKERQLIRNTRQQFNGEKAQELAPLKFAGIIIEGGIVGYDSNKYTGGLGARIMGIGPMVEWRVDVVTIGIRVVSVLTGDVLVSVSTEKTILSTNIGVNIFKFYDMGTKVLEVEAGTSTNEPVNYATRQAIEQAVVEMVREGKRKRMWTYDETKVPKQFTNIINSDQEEKTK